MFQYNLARFYAAHVQDFVYQIKQVLFGHLNFFKIVEDAFFFVNVMPCHFCITFDGVHRCSDIMAHVEQKCGFCTVCIFCIYDCFVEQFCICFFL